MSLHLPCSENAVIRQGHQPFRRSIADALTIKAIASPSAAFIKDELHRARFAKPKRR